MRGLVAIHDVTPAHGGRVKILYDTVRRETGKAPALLVVPVHHGAWPLRDHAAFVERLKRWRDAGAQILLHGYHHREEIPEKRRGNLAQRLAAATLTDKEGEFLRIDAATRREKIERGACLLEELLGARPTGFVAPAWLRSRSLREDLTAAGFTHEEGHLFVFDLKRKRRRFAPAVTFCGRGGPKTALSVAWAKAIARAWRPPFDFRLALHPADLDSPRLRREIWRLLRSRGAGCEWIGYERLLED